VIFEVNLRSKICILFNLFWGWFWVDLLFTWYKGITADFEKLP